MTDKIHFTKMHGAGNDYIYVDTTLYPIQDPVKAAIVWSDRHKGIGSDGLVLIGRSPVSDADFTMRIFNADGSEAMMCGNASRCIGKYVYDKGLTDKATVRLLTASGIKTLLLHTTKKGNNTTATVDSVTVDMQEPVFEQPSQFIGGEEDVTAFGTVFRGTFVSMGNPHFVVFVDDINKIDIAHYGASLERHPFFPERCNIEFAQPIDDMTIRARVWERGSGITEACGTGACATAVAACVRRLTGRCSRIIMDGGALDIEWSADDNHVYLTGPAEFVYEGEIAR